MTNLSLVCSSTATFYSTKKSKAVVKSLCFLVISQTGIGKQVPLEVSNLVGFLETFCGLEEVEGQNIGVERGCGFSKV